MKLVCLSKGGGYYFPPCHILEVSGFLVLLDCPLDLSALTIFSPIPTSCSATVNVDSDHSAHVSSDTESVVQTRQKLEKLLDAENLIHSEPYFKTVKRLHLWDIAFIDVVLISSPMGMLGLPFLTRSKGFSAKIYASEAAARLGQLIMEDLVTMHTEFRQFYGAEESSFPQWMKWTELEVLPSTLKEIALGKDGSDIAAWMPLYSAADVKDCMQKVQPVKYAEETCYNGTLILKAFSSGLEIGSCNWTINSPEINIACLSSSIFVSSHAMSFDYCALQGYDLILYSDFSLHDVMEDSDENNCSASAVNNSSPISGIDTQDVTTNLLLNVDENAEELEKLAFLSSSVIETVRTGGSVLLPIGRLGIVLQLLEIISSSMESSNLKVPIFFVSSVAEELLAFSNIIPEWLCKQRQEKLYSGEPLFAHINLVKDKKLQLFPAVHSDKLLRIWQEPCIIFCSHWSLRLGPAVHFLRHWCGHQNSLLVIEKEVNADIALLPFKPMTMKILQCSFLSGIKSQKVQPLLRKLQPKMVLFPGNLRQHFGLSNSIAFLEYSENETVFIPSLRPGSELDILMDLASQLSWTTLEQDNINIARLKGEISVEHGKHRLVGGSEQVVSSCSRLKLHWGMVNSQSLVEVLQKMGMNASVEQGTGRSATDESKYIIQVHEPNQALIEVTASSTFISSADEKLASLIFEAVCSSLNAI
ncbi:hypothetical protein NMG60_11017305 [Bertholletia excelsa]